jgi:tetratricopeptide (TPR) repeat protein
MDYMEAQTMTHARHWLLGAVTAVALAAAAPALRAQEVRANVTIVDLTPTGVVTEAAERLERNDHRGAAELLDGWLANRANPPAEALYLRAAAAYALGDFAIASSAVERAATIARDAPAAWLELAAKLRMDRLDFAAAIPWLTRLVEIEPDTKRYWLTLSLAYEQTGDYARSLATMQLAYSAGLLTEDAELRRLADLLLYGGVPLRAAQVLERGLSEKRVAATASAYEKLAAAWFAAGDADRAVEPLETAARLAESGDGYVKLAELEIERRNWRAAVAALNSAHDKGQLADPAQAELLMGIALYGQKEFAAAREKLEAAARSEEHAEVARRYLQAIEQSTG